MAVKRKLTEWLGSDDAVWAVGDRVRGSKRGATSSSAWCSGRGSRPWVWSEQQGWRHKLLGGVIGGTSWPGKSTAWLGSRKIDGRAEEREDLEVVTADVVIAVVIEKEGAARAKDGLTVVRLEDNLGTDWVLVVAMVIWELVAEKVR
ncbi:hypothetical protein M0R45_005024 [Rubus argutus]|uniref:Uncharacterized protein n=1 Tax=Rubus argutus TaxID=59490 RepID=A0AAW1YLG5_RUBAR